MRLWLVLAFAGCDARSGEHFEKKEPCSAKAVSAKVISAERHWTAKQVYRVGQFLGMEEPLDEVVVRICNPSSSPIYVVNGGPAPYYTDWHGRCEWRGGLATEVDAGRALVMNQFVQETDEWRRMMEVDVHWAQHGPTGLSCATLHAN